MVCSRILCAVQFFLPSWKFLCVFLRLSDATRLSRVLKSEHVATILMLAAAVAIQTRSEVHLGHASCSGCRTRRGGTFILRHSRVRETDCAQGCLWSQSRPGRGDPNHWYVFPTVVKRFFTRPPLVWIIMSATVALDAVISSTCAWQCPVKAASIY